MRTPSKVSSISALNQFLGLKKPTHPLISAFNFDEVQLQPKTILSVVSTDFYVIALKKDCAGGQCRYGQQYYDFQEGIMYFIAPQQVVRFEDVLLNGVRGFVLVFHPDFLYGHSLASQIRTYGYFSYASNEALHLSEREEETILDIFSNISREIDANMDAFSQGLLVSNLELLLKYCDRYYHRQFLTRKKANSDLLTRLETLLDDYFKKEQLIEKGLPTVHYVADQLNLSPNYLSDMLKAHTGQSTQQHIQNRVIEKAKELLSTTDMSVSEIAYQLGFEHAQSFHRLFRNRTSLSPRGFRATFN